MAASMYVALAGIGEVTFRNRGLRLDGYSSGEQVTALTTRHIQVAPQYEDLNR